MDFLWTSPGPFHILKSQKSECLQITLGRCPDAGFSFKHEDIIPVMVKRLDWQPLSLDLNKSFYRSAEQR
jgi:hypothetical protein